MLKKFVIIILCVLLSVTVAACGKSSDQQKTTTTSVTTSKTTSASTTTVNKTTSGPDFDSTPATTTKTNIEIGTKLPDGYPKDVLPVYAGSNILSAMGDGSSYVIAAVSAESTDKVMDFYKNLLKDAQVTSETALDTSFTSFGTIKNYTYTLDVGADDQYKGYKTSISITIYK